MERLLHSLIDLVIVSESVQHRRARAKNLAWSSTSCPSSIKTVKAVRAKIASFVPQIEVGSDYSRVGVPSHFGEVDSLERLVVCTGILRRSA